MPISIGKADIDETTKIFTFQDFLSAIRKYWYIVAGFIVFIVIVTSIVTYLLPTRYQATSKLFATYDTSVADSTDIANMTTADTYISGQIKSYPDLAKTEIVLTPVIRDLDLPLTVPELAKDIDVSNSSGTMLIEITAEYTDAKESKLIADRVAESLSNVISNSLNSNSPVKLTVIQKALAPQSPTSPKWKLNIVLGFFIGVILGIFAALVINALDSKLRTIRDLQDITNAPLLGSISDNPKLDSSTPIIVREPASRTAEEYRRIRTNLSFIAPVRGTNARMIVVTSSDASEAKTTMAVNLATALAENGVKVLLIDADLRHPSVAGRLGIEGNAGLVHVLSGQASVADVVQHYWKPNFHVMPAGPKPPNASLLLNSRVMDALIAQALKQYDYVIIDTGPMAVVDDAVRFGRLGNGVLLVAGRGICDKKDLREVVRQFASVDVPLIGTAMTFAEPPKKHHGNYYYYDTDGKRKQQSSHKA
jgi:capsular exopolysaccharide synthesis family protein